MREVDGVLEQIAETIEDRRIAAADWFGGAARRQRHVDRDAEVAMRRDDLLDQRESFMRSKGSPLESSVSLDRMARQRLACSFNSRTSSACSEFGLIASCSSLAISVMVASGVPSSCAAAAARPSSCDRCCSRASTSSVAASASAAGAIPR